jgi:hypothetical protein
MNIKIILNTNHLHLARIQMLVFPITVKKQLKKTN